MFKRHLFRQSRSKVRVRRALILKLKGKKVDLEATAETALLDALRDQGLIDRTDEPSAWLLGKGVNRNNHILLEFKDPLLRIGLKGIKSGRLGGEGPRYEFVVAKIAEMLEVRARCPTVRCNGIAKLGELDGKDFVAIRWSLGRDLEFWKQDDPSEFERIRDVSDPFLTDFGEWVATGLICGIGDAGGKHWVWDAHASELTRIDNEDALRNSSPAVADYRAPLNIVGLLGAVGKDGPEKTLVTARIVKIVERYQLRKEEVNSLLSDEAIGYSNSWHSLSPDDFAAEVVSKLK